METNFLNKSPSFDDLRLSVQNNTTQQPARRSSMSAAQELPIITTSDSPEEARRRVAKAFPSQEALVEPTNKGYSEQASYRVQCNGKTYHLKFATTADNVESFRREILYNYHRAGLGMSPGVVFGDVREGTLLTNFINGTIDDWWNKPPYVQRVLKQLVAIHGYERQPTLGNDAARVATKLAGLAQEAMAAPGANREEVANIVSFVERLVERLRGLSYHSTLCHGDFHQANLIADADKIWVIDWQWVGRGDPVEELANFCYHIGYDLAASQELLRNFPCHEIDRDERFAVRLWIKHVEELLSGIRGVDWPVDFPMLRKLVTEDMAAFDQEGAL